jgi:hypothetical protein
MHDLSFGLAKKAKDAERSTKALFKKLKKKPPPDLDEIVHRLHHKTFETIDCLNCANCCRNLGPRLTDRDIERLAGYLKIKPSVYTDRYLRIDEDGDYVFREVPCPHLMQDNRCSVYDERPKACREYPHTDRKKFYQLLELSLKNTHICPAVFEIVEELKISYGKM